MDRLLTASYDSKYNLGKHELRHKFLYLPYYLMALMSRDLCKLRAQINFDSDGMEA
jgi:hypothetical protein